jgi:hypothetical protein
MVEPTNAYLLLTGYLLLHSAAYFLVLRKLAAFQAERVIFLYHLVSAVATTLLTLATFPLLPPNIALDTTIGLIAAHGIYSISFLELWALADDSYSLAILRRFEANGPVKEPGALLDLLAIGERKQRGRIQTLVRFGFIFEDCGKVFLTPSGRMVAKACQSLLRMINAKQQG